MRHIHVLLTSTGDIPTGERSIWVQEVSPWFSALVYPRGIPYELLSIKSAKPRGNLIIYPDPADEIRELWREIMPFGLTDMRERADALGGWLTLEPRPKGGLRVESHLPFLPGPE